MARKICLQSFILRREHCFEGLKSTFFSVAQSLSNFSRKLWNLLEFHFLEMVATVRHIILVGKFRAKFLATINLTNLDKVEPRKRIKKSVYLIVKTKYQK